MRARSGGPRSNRRHGFVANHVEENQIQHETFKVDQPYSPDGIHDPI